VKVLLLFTHGISLNDWHDTGIINREIKFYKKLNERYGFSFIFFTYGDSRDFKYAEKYNWLTIVPIYHYIPKLSSNLKNILNVLLKSPKIFEENNLFFDIIKTNQLQGAWLGIYSKIKFKKPLFIRTGYDLYLFSKKDKKRKSKSIFYYVLTFLSLNFSDIYTVSSTSDFEFIKKKYVFNKSKLKLRRNWIVIKNDESEKEKTDNKILAVGRLEEQKDMKYLINVFNETEYVLDIVGEGSLKSELTKISGNNIRFFGRLNYDELIERYEDYRYYISSSDYEGNPKSLIEAMSRGCIAIVPNIPNYSEIVSHNENGILYSKEDDNLLEIIRELDKSDLSKIIKNSKNYINTNYSIENSLDYEFKDYKKITK
tara:strand:+ start:993 stop:2102 length:1110 start_codon:yes stop_codon:yes gene_type:complete